MMDIAVLGTTLLLLTLIYELTSTYTREWGENSKSFF